MNQRTPAPGTLIPKSDFSFRGTHRPEGSLGRGNRKRKQWRPGRLRSVTNPENEPPDPDFGASRIWAWVPRYRVQPRAGPPTPTPGLCGRGQLGSGLGAHYLLSLPQNTGRTETSNLELTQLAREKMPSTAPMVTLATEAADPETSSAVLAASRGVSAETRQFLRPETRG